MCAESTIEKCHICRNDTDFFCDKCENPVCEDCCVQMTEYNHIDYPLCQDCQDTNEAYYYLERSREWKREDEAKAKKEARNAKARANYWKPENVEKRRLAREKRKREKVKLARKQLKETLKAVSSFFR